MKYKKKKSTQQYFLGSLINSGTSMITKGLGANEKTSQIIGSSLGAIGDGLTGNFVGAGVNAMDLVSDATDDKNVDKVTSLLSQAAPLLGTMNNNKNSKEMASGGKLTSYESGGTHEQNPNGGIQIGNASVEEGETRDKDYIFSERLKINKTLAKEFNLPKKAIGLSFSEASKLFQDDDRQNDIISNRGYEKEIENLKKAQEAFKDVEGIKQPQNQFAPGGLLPLNNLYNIPENNNPESDPMYDPNEIDKSGRYILPEVEVGNNQTNSQKSKTSSSTLPLDNLETIPENYPEDNDIEKMKTSFVNGSSRKKEDGNNLASLLRYAPIASNIGTLINVLSNKPDYQDASQFQTNTKFTRNEVDMEQAKRDIESESSGIKDTIVNSSPNAGALMGNLQGVDLNTKRALGNVNLKKDQMDAAENSRVEQLDYQQDARNKAMSLQTENMNDQDKAAYEAAINQIIAMFGQNMGGIGQEETNREMMKSLPIQYIMDMFGKTNYKKQSNA